MENQPLISEVFDVMAKMSTLETKLLLKMEERWGVPHLGTDEAYGNALTQFMKGLGALVSLYQELRDEPESTEEKPDDLEDLGDHPIMEVGMFQGDDDRPLI